jgi:hypothetical protein
MQREAAAGAGDLVVGVRREDEHAAARNVALPLGLRRWCGRPD